MLKVKGNRGACLPSCRFTAVLSSYKKSNLSGSSVYQQSNPDCLRNCLECKNYFVVSHFNLHTQLSRRNDMDINCTFPRPQPFQQAFQLHTFLWSREKKRARGLWFAARFRARFPCKSGSSHNARKFKSKVNCFMIRVCYTTNSDFFFHQNSNLHQLELVIC